jgi:integrase
MLSDSEIKSAVLRGHLLFAVTDKDGLPVLNEQGKPVINKVSSKLDSDNLWFEILDSGKGCWRLRYTNPKTAKPTRMSLGTYPETGLGLARDKAEKPRKQIAAGRDPVEERKKEIDALRAKRAFEVVIKEWFAAFRENDMSRSTSTREADERSRDQLIALFGPKMIGSITIAEIHDALLAVANADGHKAKARQLRAMLKEVFMYAIAKLECKGNPAASHKFKLPKLKPKKLPAIVTPSQVAELLRAIRDYDGRLFTTAALMVLAYTFVRPANIIKMEWDEIVDGVWIIPAHKMKMRKQHRVPLSRQVLAILAELRKLTNSKYVFSTSNKPMGSKTLNRALGQLGYATKHCAHGFRSTASTLLNAECRWPAAIIELQLAHGDEDKVAAAYNRVLELDSVMGEQQPDVSDKLWQVRTKMMHHWADRLDALRDSSASNVIQLRKAA